MPYIFKKIVFIQLFACLFLLSACAYSDSNNAYNDEDLNYILSSHDSLKSEQNSATGNYLAGRFAQHNNDWRSANGFMQEVLISDKDNTSLLHRSFLLALGGGDLVNAENTAKQIISNGRDIELATIMMLAKDIAEDNIEEAWRRTERLKDSQFNDYMQPIVQAWILVMLGSEDVALLSLEKHISVFENDPLYLLHMALISEYAKKYDKAEIFYQKVLNSKELTVYSALTVASYYQRQGQEDKVAMIYNQISGQANSYNALSLPNMMELFGKSRAEPKEALSLVMFELSTLLFERKAYDSALIYARMAQILSPESPLVAIMLGDISAVHGNYDEAVMSYNSVAKETGMLRFAKLKAAEILEANGRGSEAIELLLNTSKEEKLYSDTLVYLGDIYRRNEQHEKAIQSYNVALQRIGTLKAEHWFIIYARGVSNERLSKWNKAEQDLLAALALQPDNPIILNYLGYSWVDKGINLKQAISMIKKAVSLRPGDGYITDSYGWAMYRTGKFNEAVEWLEYSSEKVPYDMTINDHLGDAYWRVDRRTEAKFQWKRAYNATSDRLEKQRLAKKIKQGLPAIKKISIELDPEREAMLH